MATVRLIARIVACEGKEDELKQLLRGMIKPTRAEKGCLFYELFESNHRGILYFNELWESQADLDAHMASSHFAEIVGKAKELFKQDPEIDLLQEVQ